MEMLTLNNGYRMPTVALGTSRIKEEEMDNVIQSAIDHGYRHFDTAQLYLRSNRAFGNTISNAWLSGKVDREDLFLTTKLSNFYHQPHDVTVSLQKCLETLHTDYVDLFLIHFPYGAKREVETTLGFYSVTSSHYDIVDHLDLWKAMEQLVKAGMTRSIGLSGFNLQQLTNIVENCEIKPAVLQTECHVYLQEPDLVRYCQENEIIFSAFAPFGSPGLSRYNWKLGLNARKTNKGYGVTGHETKITINTGMEGNDSTKDKTILELAQHYQKTAAQVILHYLVQKGLSIIPKSSNFKRLQDNMSIFDFALAPNDMNEITKLDKGRRVFTFPNFKGHPQYPYKDE